MRVKKDSWLMNKPIAHRGLWGGNVPENSTAAYEAAAANGYPVEIDLHFTKDKQIVSFHDDTLERMTGVKGNVSDYTYDEIKNFRLSGTDYTIPLFTKVLEICEGKSPLLIEIKNSDDDTLVDETVKILKNYKGEFAVQSFNPLYIKRVKKLAPEFIRGILACKDPGGSRLQRRVIRNMSLNFLIKPDFISYCYSGYPLPPRKIKNKVCLAWTVTSYEIWDKVKPYIDNIIFENFTLD